MRKRRAGSEYSWMSDSMKEAIKVLNEMVASGVINDYAIGGAMGATFVKNINSKFRKGWQDDEAFNREAIC